MKKIYLVWCRYEGDEEDRIRGFSLNWQRAERMARTLEFHSSGSIEVGVKTYVNGELSLNGDECDNRWGTDDFEEEQDETFTTID